MRYLFGFLCVFALAAVPLVGCGATGDGGMPECENAEDCDDENECTEDACDPTDGTCDSTPVEDGTLCAGGLCIAGECDIGALPEVRFLTQGDAYDWWPCFSGDGSSVLFSRRPGSGGSWELREVPIVGGLSTPFVGVALPVEPTRTSRSPSGDRYVFSGRSGPGVFSIWTISAVGTDAQPITVDGLSGHLVYPYFYPDGNRLVVTDGDGGPAGVLRMVDPELGTIVPLTDRSEVLATLAVVSPDGQRIAFSGQRNLGQDFNTVENSILFLESNGEITQPDERQGKTPAWSPDGQWIAFESYRGSSDEQMVGTRKAYAVFVMRPDGTEVRQLTDPPLDANHPVFSPDGTKIAFSAFGPETLPNGAAIAIIDFNPGK